MKQQPRRKETNTKDNAKASKKRESTYMVSKVRVSESRQVKTKLLTTLSEEARR
jgi:hypothetical protein